MFLNLRFNVQKFAVKINKVNKNLIFPFSKAKNEVESENY